jgi:hypothetical protein
MHKGGFHFMIFKPFVSEVNQILHRLLLIRLVLKSRGRKNNSVDFTQTD